MWVRSGQCSVEDGAVGTIQWHSYSPPSSFNLKVTSESSISSNGSASLLISEFNNIYIQGLFMNSFNFFFRGRRFSCSSFYCIFCIGLTICPSILQNFFFFPFFWLKYHGIILILFFYFFSVFVCVCVCVCVRGFPGGASSKEPACQCRRLIRDTGSIPGLRRSSGGVRCNSQP